MKKLLENFRPIKFLNLLPEIFRGLNSKGTEENHITYLLRPYEDSFEELLTSIEGKVYYTKLLSVNEVDTERSQVNICLDMSGEDFLNIFNVDDADPGYFKIIQEDYLDKGYVSVSGVLELTASNVIKFDTSFGVLNLTIKYNPNFIDNIFQGDIIMLRIGDGISDLFNPLRLEAVLNNKSDITKKAVLNDEADITKKKIYEKQFLKSPKDSEMQRLRYIAGWVGLPLRDDKGDLWNRRFVSNVLKYSDEGPSIWRRRSTLKGLQELLKEWLKDDVEEDYDTYPIIVSDMTRQSNFAPSAFMIRKHLSYYKNEEIIPPTIGVNTVLGDGVPYYFVVDILLKNKKQQSHNIRDILTIFNSAKFLLNNEKPAYTQCQLTVRTYTMCLAPKKRDQKEDVSYCARIGVTTLLWKNHMTIKL